MAKAILVANWKNYPESSVGARALLSGLAKNRATFKKLHFYLAPPTVYWEEARKRVSGFSNLAAQDLPPVASGTHTSLIGLDIYKSFGIKMAILGHSERRALGETSKQVAVKAKLAIKSGFIPLICVGEKKRDEEGRHFEFLRQQIKASLEGLKKKDEAKKVMIAYEPVWAIGKKAKNAMSPEDLSEMAIFIRKVLSDMYGREVAEKIPVLYGGSVEPDNAQKLYRETGVRGFLVGHVSLDAKMFGEIAKSLI